MEEANNIKNIVRIMKHLKGKYTSVELQKEAIKLWGEKKYLK